MRKPNKAYYGDDEKKVLQTHLDWTTPLITRKAAKEKQKFTGWRKYKGTVTKRQNFTEQVQNLSITRLQKFYQLKNQTKVFHFLPFVPADNPQSFFAQHFFLFFLFSLNEKVLTELRGQKDD